jgi:hypothetical protein
MMKKLLTFFVVAALLVATAPAMAAVTYTIDFGAPDVLSNAGIILYEWGEAESGGGASGRADGNYGLIGNGNCRMVWGHTASGDLTDWAQIVFPTAITSITIDHLDGTQYDSFNVYVDGVLWGGYVGTDGGTEVWKTTTFSGVAGSTVVIDITSPASTWREDWGQLAIDAVEATPVPEPVTIALLGLGGLLLRRRRN